MKIEFSKFQNSKKVLSIRTKLITLNNIQIKKCAQLVLTSKLDLYANFMNIHKINFKN